MQHHCEHVHAFYLATAQLLDRNGYHDLAGICAARAFWYAVLSRIPPHRG